MGCHTFFHRPLTGLEFHLMKQYAKTEAYELCIEAEYCDDKELYNKICKSVDEDIPCIYGKYWWELGWGVGNPELKGISVSNIRDRKVSSLFVDCSRPVEDTDPDKHYYFDVFRVTGYPLAIIHNRRELRRFLREDYFKLSKYQLEQVSLFFKENPGGVITFG